MLVSARSGPRLSLLHLAEPHGVGCSLLPPLERVFGFLITDKNRHDRSFLSRRGEFWRKRLSQVTLLYTLTPERSSAHAHTHPCPPPTTPPCYLSLCPSVPFDTDTHRSTFTPALLQTRDLSRHCIDGHTSTLQGRRKVNQHSLPAKLCARGCGHFISLNSHYKPRVTIPIRQARKAPPRQPHLFLAKDLEDWLMCRRSHDGPTGRVRIRTHISWTPEPIFPMKPGCILLSTPSTLCSRHTHHPQGEAWEPEAECDLTVTNWEEMGGRGCGEGKQAWLCRRSLVWYGEGVGRHQRAQNERLPFVEAPVGKPQPVGAIGSRSRSWLKSPTVA